MRKYGGILAAIAAAGLLAALATPSDAAPRRAMHARSSAFDGLWSVLIQTQAGPCSSSYRYPARIVHGTVMQAAGNDFSYQINGAVVASGGIAVTVTQGGQSATGYGRLRGRSGGGRWSAGNNACYGIWSAIKRG